MSSHVHIGMYNALREAGASEETARAGAVDIPVAQNLATKEDLLQAIAPLDRAAPAPGGAGRLPWRAAPPALAPAALPPRPL